MNKHQLDVYKNDLNNLFHAPVRVKHIQLSFFIKLIEQVDCLLNGWPEWLDALRPRYKDSIRGDAIWSHVVDVFVGATILSEMEPERYYPLTRLWTLFHAAMRYVENNFENAGRPVPYSIEGIKSHHTFHHVSGLEDFLQPDVEHKLRVEEAHVFGDAVHAHSGLHRRGWALPSAGSIQEAPALKPFAWSEKDQKWDWVVEGSVHHVRAMTEKMTVPDFEEAMHEMPWVWSQPGISTLYKRYAAPTVDESAIRALWQRAITSMDEFLQAKNLRNSLMFVGNLYVLFEEMLIREEIRWEAEFDQLPLSGQGGPTTERPAPLTDEQLVAKLEETHVQLHQELVQTLAVNKPLMAPPPAPAPRVPYDGKYPADHVFQAGEEIGLDDFKALILMKNTGLLRQPLLLKVIEEFDPASPHFDSFWRHVVSRFLTTLTSGMGYAPVDQANLANPGVGPIEEYIGPLQRAVHETVEQFLLFQRPIPSMAAVTQPEPEVMTAPETPPSPAGTQGSLEMREDAIQMAITSLVRLLDVVFQGDMDILNQIVPTAAWRPSLYDTYGEWLSKRLSVREILAYATHKAPTAQLQLTLLLRLGVLKEVRIESSGGGDKRKYQLVLETIELGRLPVKARSMLREAVRALVKQSRWQFSAAHPKARFVRLGLTLGEGWPSHDLWIYNYTDSVDVE